MPQSSGRNPEEKLNQISQNPNYQKNNKYIINKLVENTNWQCGTKGLYTKPETNKVI